MRAYIVFVEYVVGGDQGAETDRPTGQNDVLDGGIDARALDAPLIGEMRVVASGDRRR